MRLLSRCFAASGIMCSVFVGARCAHGATAPILDLNGATLTSNVNKPATLVQGLSPRFDQRGVDIDGTLRSSAVLGWTVHGDALGGGYSSGRTLGDVNLCTGTYHPTEIDLALPTLGLPIVIGRSFNGVQEHLGPLDSAGYQGFNWAQLSQPELVLMGGEDPADYVLYLVYGADRYVEFGHTSSSSTEYKAKNGAAGVIKFVAGEGGAADQFTYYDQRGNASTFFGFNAGAGAAKGQLWKMTDPAGMTAYVESLTASSAISSGYHSDGRIKRMVDASAREYVFTYNTFGGLTRLQKVEAKVSSTIVAQVDYDYYTTTTTDSGSLGIGLAGDLKTATVTMKGTPTTDYVRTKHYRYYTASYTNSTGLRGNPHQIRMVVGFDGVRQKGSGYDTAADSVMMPYAESYFEYVSSGDNRIANATFNGNCGCSGGSSGTFYFTYAQSSGYASNISDTSYQGAWDQRTVVQQPDGVFATHYFDETGAAMGRAVTSTVPTGSPAKTWVTYVTRDTSGTKGVVLSIHSPANCSSYNHTNWTVNRSTSVGLVTEYGRHYGPDNLDGLRESVTVREGTTSGSTSMVSSLTMTDRQLLIGATSGVSTVQVDSTSTYPNGSAIDTIYVIDSSTDALTGYWSSTNTNVLYISAKGVRTESPTVVIGHNGSNGATYTYSFMREDGSTAFTKDAGNILFYLGRSDFGQSSVQIADSDTSISGDYNAAGVYPVSDAPGNWSLSTSGSDPIHAKTTMTYDDQGRQLSRTQPSVGGGRTLKWIYTIDSNRLGTYSFPRYATSTYYGPATYSRVNHLGRVDRREVVDVGSGLLSAPTAAPSTGISAKVDTVYDPTGMRIAETQTYLPSGYDSATVGYDAMGRISRTVDATGTIRRTKFDERGMVIERSIGTNDNGETDPTGSGSGTTNMTQIEALEYDNAASGGGQNGLLTKRTQDADGSWGGTSDQRVTTIKYDYRGRPCVQINPVAPHTVTKYDNSNRAVAVGLYSLDHTSLTAGTDPTSNATVGSGPPSVRLALNETAYDERGQVYQSVRWQVDQTSGMTGDSLATDNWYDANGRPIKTWGPQITKTWHDRLGRPFVRFVLAECDDTTYSNALLVDGDSVIQEAHTGMYSQSGQALLQYSIQRYHLDPLVSAITPGTDGVLDPDSDTDTTTVDPTEVMGRIQMSATWYDELDRVIESVNLGTNSDAPFTYGAVPTRDGDHLRTSYVYDDSGRIFKVIDPNGIESRTDYDVAGRRSHAWGNYVTGSPGGSGGTNPDQDQKVTYAYGAGSQVTSIVREMPSSGDNQTVTYTYGTLKSGTYPSQVATGHLLNNILYDIQTPSQAPALRTMSYTYNALSQTHEVYEPNGSGYELLYDNGGRVIEHYTPGVPSYTAVGKIKTTYTPRGQVATVQQTDTSNNPFDTASFDYDGWGNPVEFTQDFAGARAAFTSTYSYDIPTNLGFSGPRRVLQTGWSQPDGTGGGFNVTMDYGDLTDQAIGRPTTLTDENNTPIVFYGYLGACTVVNVEYPEPLLYCRAYGHYLNEVAMEIYEEVDGFNRPIHNQWYKYLGGPTVDKAFVDFAMTYNPLGQATTIQDNVLVDVNVARAFDQKNSFDGLRRLTARDEGKLTSGSISTRSRAENLTRNLSGRIITDQLTLNNDSDYIDGPPDATAAGEMNDARTYNLRNELRTRSVLDSTNPSTARPVTLTYDENGNITDDDEKFKYVYDVRNRLIEIKDHTSSASLVTYRYNGLGMRIAECSSDYGPTMYIASDLSGRRLATFREQDDYPKETFAWHPAGMGGPNFRGGVILRDRDDKYAGDPVSDAEAEASETREERIYHCSDFRGNVSALVSAGGSPAGGGVMVEQYRYSSTGVPYGIPLGDVTSDGLVDVAGDDGTAMTSAIGGTYQVNCDLDLDGVNDSNDDTIMGSHDTDQTGRGGFSTGSIQSKIGFENSECMIATSELAMIGVEQGCGDNFLISGASSGSIGTDACISCGNGGMSQTAAPPSPAPPTAPPRPFPGRGPTSPITQPGDLHPPEWVPRGPPQPEPGRRMIPAKPGGESLPSTKPLPKAPGWLRFCPGLRQCVTACNIGLACGESLSPEFFPDIDPNIQPGAPPPITPPADTEACKSATADKVKYCDHRLRSPDRLPYVGIPGSPERALFCNTVMLFNLHAEKCLDARRRVRDECYGGKDDSGRKHREEEEQVQTTIEELRSIRNALCSDIVGP